MKALLILLGVCGLLSVSMGCVVATQPRISAQAQWQIQEHWAEVFDRHEAVGTILVLDQREHSGTALVWNPARAETRYSPASTFKIPHALFALDAGVVQDEFQMFPWDGVTRSYEPWNRDQDLRSSMRHSVVWVYQEIAGKIGEARERAYLKSIRYGNADPSGGVDGFWIDGQLRINAYEQIDFLQRLYNNELPFQLEHQRLVKDIMIVEAERTWILRAKTGWEGRYGWWVGWVEHPSGPVFFALNIDTPMRMEDLHKRAAITREILRDIGALPEKQN